MSRERERIQEVINVIHFLESKEKKCIKIYVGDNFYINLVANNFFAPDTNPNSPIAGRLLGLPLVIEHRLGDSFYVESDKSSEVQ